MKKTIIIHDDFIEVLQDGYNIIEQTIYDNNIVLLAKQLLTEIKGEL